MNKDVKPYKQKGNTCSIACMLMVLLYFKRIDKIDWYEEKRLYKIYKSKNMEGTPLSSVAYHLAKNGLDVSIYHEDRELFRNNGVFESDKYNLLINEYNEYLGYGKNKGLNVISGIDVTIELLIRMLKEDNIIILAGQIDKMYHSIIICGYDENGFIVCDPLYKEKQYKSFEEINKYMSTDIGKWFITVKEENKMNIEIERIDIKDKNRLDSIIQMYMHDISLWFPMDFDSKKCKYTYETDKYFEDNYAYFIKNNDDVLGFILVDDNKDDNYEISEYFVLNNYKRKGIGEIAAFKVFDEFRGNWTIKALPKSPVAEGFWKKIVDKYTDGKYELEYVGKYNRAVFHFNNK